MLAAKIPSIVEAYRGGHAWRVGRHAIWFWLKFREAGGWSIASKIDTRFVW
jgi:hypothetical protein